MTRLIRVLAVGTALLMAQQQAAIVKAIPPSQSQLRFYLSRDGDAHGVFIAADTPDDWPVSVIDSNHQMRTVTVGAIRKLAKASPQGRQEETR